MQDYIAGGVSRYASGVTVPPPVEIPNITPGNLIKTNRRYEWCCMDREMDGWRRGDCGQSSSSKYLAQNHFGSITDGTVVMMSQLKMTCLS